MFFVLEDDCKQVTLYDTFMECFLENNMDFDQKMFDTERCEKICFDDCFLRYFEELRKTAE